MKKKNVILEKSFAFAVRIIGTCQILAGEKKQFILANQLLRSGTSVGANIEEAMGAQSERDFFMKMTIAYKEARESHYWIRLCMETGYLSNKKGFSLLNDAEELLKIIGSIQTTLRKKMQTHNS